jgi:hypothetical protein
LKLKTKPGGEGQVFSSKSRRRRTSSGAELGGEGKPEASHHQQQATEAVNNTITAQLQASGRNLANTSLLVHDSSMYCYRISP